MHLLFQIYSLHVMLCHHLSSSFSAFSLFLETCQQKPLDAALGRMPSLKCVQSIASFTAFFMTLSACICAHIEHIKFSHFLTAPLPFYLTCLGNIFSTVSRVFLETTYFVTQFGGLVGRSTLTLFVYSDISFKQTHTIHRIWDSNTVGNRMLKRLSFKTEAVEVWKHLVMFKSILRLINKLAWNMTAIHSVVSKRMKYRSNIIHVRLQKNKTFSGDKCLIPFNVFFYLKAVNFLFSTV